MKRWLLLIAWLAVAGSARAWCLDDWCWWKKWYNPSCQAPGCCPKDSPMKCPGTLPACVGSACDDYCPKAFPPVFPLVPGPWHTCGPPERCDCPRDHAKPCPCQP